MAADISRHSLRPAQLYTGVVRQQGRLPIDADETESDDLGALLLRQVVAETICSRGSPDDGFAISNVTLAGGLLDFDIGAGSFYLNGTRLVSTGHEWSTQPDWLTMVDADRAFALPPANQTRTDLLVVRFDAAVRRSDAARADERDAKWPTICAVPLDFRCAGMHTSASDGGGAVPHTHRMDSPRKSFQGKDRVCRHSSSMTAAC